MNIAILGAAGKTGTLLVDQALQDGHQVTAFLRSPAEFKANRPGLTVVTGDAREPSDVAKSLVGVDAVISVLGSMKGGDQLLTRSTQVLVTAAQDAGVTRVVMLSSFLVADNYKANLVGRLAGGMMRGMVADKSAGETTLIRSGLDWTIVYATGLDKSKAGTPVRVVLPAETVSMSNGIARADVARFLLDELSGAGHNRAKVVITSK